MSTSKKNAFIYLLSVSNIGKIHTIDNKANILSQSEPIFAGKQFLFGQSAKSPLSE